MGLPAENKTRFTVAEYLRVLEGSEEKFELHEGELVSMAGGTYNHSVIAASLCRELGNALRGKPCRASDSNLRIRIPRKAILLFPDVTVVCGKPQFDPEDPSGTSVTNPRVVIEVLSPSTEGYDRGEKFTRYRELDSLEEYVLVSQNEARIEAFLRQPDGVWLFTPVEGLDKTIHLKSLDLTIALAEVYAGVEFPVVSTEGNKQVDAAESSKPK